MPTATVVDLATQASDLSSKLHAIDESVKRSAADVESIANEIAILSAVLWRLHETMTFDPRRYTESFQQDLEEITSELKLVFEEIFDVVTELEKEDGLHDGVVKRLLKKGKVRYLQKHLEALKTTLAVMKTVLQHGCEYSPDGPRQDIFKAPPHTLREEHAILDSIFLNNENAIQELHKLDEEYQKARSTEDRHRRSSSGLSDIPEFPPLPDALSPIKASVGSKPPKTLGAKSFSRRGVRLGVHMSILDMGAHAAPDILKDKWVNTSRAHVRARRASSGSNSKSNLSGSLWHAQGPQGGQTTTRRTVAGEDLPTGQENDPAAAVSGQGKISHVAAQTLHKIIDQLDIASHSDKTVIDGKGHTSLSSMLVPSSLRHKRSKSAKQELMDAFPTEVRRSDRGPQA